MSTTKDLRQLLDTPQLPVLSTEQNYEFQKVHNKDVIQKLATYTPKVQAALIACEITDLDVLENITSTTPDDEIINNVIAGIVDEQGYRNLCFERQDIIDHGPYDRDEPVYAMATAFVDYGCTVTISTSYDTGSETYGDEFEIDDIEWSTQLELSMDDLSPNNQKEI